MNHVVGSTTRSPRALRAAGLVAVFLILAGCGVGGGSQITVTPDLRIVEESPQAGNPPIVIATSPAASATPSPTPLSTPVRSPTPRQVTVSRVDPDIDPRLVTPVAEGFPVPDLTLFDVNGNAIPLAAYAHDEIPLVLNFWSVGCGSCFYEFPLLAAAAEHHGPAALGVVSINIADMPEETRLFAEQLGANFPVVVDPGAELFTTYFNGAVVPTTIFLYADGTVSEVMIGPFDAFNLDLQLQQLGLSPMPVQDPS